MRTLAQRTLEWCQPGAHAFFRESCFRQSGDVSRAFNPSHYRHPSFYTRVFSGVRARGGPNFGGFVSVEIGTRPFQSTNQPPQHTHPPLPTNKFLHPSSFSFLQVRCEDAEGRVWGLELVRSRNLQTYVEVRHEWMEG